jgi:hypothetical protein
MCKVESVEGTPALREGLVKPTYDGYLCCVRQSLSEGVETRFRLQQHTITKTAGCLQNCRVTSGSAEVAP